MIVAGAAPDFVIARTGIELVVTRIALEDVVTQTAGDDIIVGAALEGVAVGHALGQVDLVVATAAAQGAADTGQAESTDQGVIARARIGIEHHAAQARGIDHIVARTGVDDHPFDTRIGLVPAVKFDVDGAALAREDEVLVAVGGVEVLALTSSRAGIDGQRVA